MTYCACVVYVGGPLTDNQANSLLATQSVAISPVSPVYAHHHHHHQHQQQLHQLGGTAAPRQVDFTRSSPSMMPTVDLAGDSPDDDVRVTSYAQPIPLDGFCSPTPNMSAPVCTPLVGVGFADDRPSPNSALQLIDYVPARATDCGPYGHLSVRGDIYRSMSTAPTDPFAGDMCRAFSVPPLKCELI